MALDTFGFRIFPVSVQDTPFRPDIRHPELLQSHQRNGIYPATSPLPESGTQLKLPGRDTEQ